MRNSSATMAERGGDRLKIFMYPWFAMGHIIPYFITAKKFAVRGHTVFLTVPPKAESKLRSTNIHDGAGNVHLLPMKLPRVDGLPPEVETTNDVSFREAYLIVRAIDRTAPEIQSLLSELNPDAVVFDSFMHWLPIVARQMQIKSVNFSVASPVAMGFLFSESTAVEDLMSPPLGHPADFKLDKQSAIHLQNFLTEEHGDGMSLGQRALLTSKESDAVLFKTCEYLEGKYCKFLEKLKKPVLLTGPILDEPEASDLDEKWKNWLDKFKPKSLIYCAFGSEAVLTKDDFQSLLLGLESTNLPFLVALRPPQGFECIEDALPEGFTARVGERGAVHGGWVPQIHILAHVSVGCFITHCGYGSLWEALMIGGGYRIVALPHAADQYVNAKILSEDLRVAVEIEKAEDGKLAKEAVVRALTAVMVDGNPEVDQNLESLRKQLMHLKDACFDHFLDNLGTLLK